MTGGQQTADAARLARRTRRAVEHARRVVRNGAEEQTLRGRHGCHQVRVLVARWSWRAQQGPDVRGRRLAHANQHERAHHEPDLVVQEARACDSHDDEA